MNDEHDRQIHERLARIEDNSSRAVELGGQALAAVNALRQVQDERDARTETRLAGLDQIIRGNGTPERGLAFRVKDLEDKETDRAVADDRAALLRAQREAESATRLRRLLTSSHFWYPLSLIAAAIAALFGITIPE